MVDDFSKIDVWALAVLLMNMLTDDFAFPNILDGYNLYTEFMSQP